MRQFAELTDQNTVVIVSEGPDDWTPGLDRWAWVRPGDSPEPGWVCTAIDKAGVGTFAAPMPQPITRQQAIDAAQRHIDRTLQARGYDGVISLPKYIPVAHPVYTPEAVAGLKWNAACWDALWAFNARLEAGKAPIPTTEAEILAVLPEMVWP